jgi:glycosyltransferase involved in cell wall biosynthesis
VRNSRSPQVRQRAGEPRTAGQYGRAAGSVRSDLVPFCRNPKVVAPTRGVLSPLKNVLGLLNAFAQVRQAVPEARLILAGPHPDPDYAQAVQGRVTSLALGDSVDIVGLLDNDRLRQEIATARAVVLFSRQENSPTIIAQAMAAGKPVIAARVGGVPEMINDGESGFVVESEDETALAERMLTLLNDQDLCLRMGARGHELALCRFNPEAIATQTVQAYRTALNSQQLNHSFAR